MTPQKRPVTMGEFAARLNEEIKDPLSLIEIIAEDLRDRCTKNNYTRKQLSLILLEVQRIVQALEWSQRFMK